MTTDPETTGGAARIAARGKVDGKVDGKIDAVVARYSRTRERLDATAAGHVHRRITEVDVANQALILAAMAFMLLVPVLVSIAALVPLGGADAGLWAQRLGLSPQATHEVQLLFPPRDTVLGGTTILGTVFAVFSAFSWPAALRRGYELVWNLPSSGWRSLWRPMFWLATFLAVGALSGGSAPLIVGAERTTLLVVIGLPLAVAWAWWTQHLLLGGRIGWRALLPGAVAIGVGLLGLRLFAAFYLSTSIIHHFVEYGPLGIVFVVLSWLVGFSTVMLGGAVAGAAWFEHRQGRKSAAGVLSPGTGDVSEPGPA